MLYRRVGSYEYYASLSLHCAQCIVIGPVCVFVCLWRAGGVCYYDNSLRASIFTKLDL